VKRTHPGCLRAIVAANIRRYRKALGLSQQNFAYDIEMDRTYFGGIERGERNVAIDNIERIAAGLKISPYLLLIDPGPSDKGAENLSE
jgi:transcriptional regulator with XRE-family HTH domain